MIEETTTRHIKNEIERLKELTGLNLKDDKLSGLEYENHKLVSTRPDTSETDIMQKRKYSKTQFYDIINYMVRLMEEIQRQKSLSVDDYKDTYDLVTIDIWTIKQHIEQLKQTEEIDYEFTDKDLKEIASDLEDNYQPDWDLDTALDEQINNFLLKKGLNKSNE